VNKRLAAIIRRREELLARTAAQRAAVATITHRWRRPLRLFDTAVRLLHAVHSHPVLIALAAMLLTRTRYARLVRRAGYAGAVWRLFRALAYKRAPTRAAAR
jgi:hypothetical protein